MKKLYFVRTIFLAGSLLLVLLSVPVLAHAQGTAFTYQGRLSDNGSPANGNYDLLFHLRDAPTSGNPVGTTNTLAPVPVSNGLFTVSLDFGAEVFNGPPRWLEIGVRTNGSVAPHLTLSPRQALTPSPYATYAANAATAGTASSVANGAVVKSLNNLHDNLTLAAGANMTITPNGNTLTLAATGAGGSGIWSVNGNNTYYNAGNVGLGTSTPAHRLSLSGGPSWTANGWLGALELPHIAAIGWRANAAGQRFGMGHTDTGFYMFRTASDPGTIGSPAIYDFTINDLGSVGIGTTDPSGRLQVKGDWSGEQGALQLSGHRPTIRFTGDADSGNESWLLHLGGTGPGNLGFFRRTGPAAWSPVMQLTTSGRQMEIYGQDALGLIGYQPFLTLFDSSSGYAASRIQAASGDLILETASYIAGQFDTGLVVKNGTGFVGIGTLAPVAKLHAQTSLEGKAAVYGNATGAGGIGVYGQSVSGAAVHAQGNATQARDKGGFVKAMAYINPYLPADQYVVRCYNSQQAGNAGSTAPCGITVTRYGVGSYKIDFGFNVEDRYFSVTPIDEFRLVVIFNVVGNGVGVNLYNPADPDDREDSRFQIIVY